jgi:hypothetical protein
MDVQTATVLIAGIGVIIRARVDEYRQEYSSI